MTTPTERRNLEQRVESMEFRLARGDSRMGAIERSLDENTTKTTEVLEIVTMGKSFFRVAGQLANGIKWSIGLVAASVAVWTAWTHK